VRRHNSSLPLVSVILPVFNAGRFVAEAVQSIIAQTFTDFEVVVVDDGSSDCSPEILRRLAEKDGRIRVINRPNTGIVGALNDAITLAKGELLARMDADDIALPDRFARQVAYLDNHPDCAAVGGAVVVIDGDGDEICRREVATDHETIDRELIESRGGRICHPTVMMRTDVVRRVGCYRQEYLWAEDIDLFLRLAEVGRLANLAEPCLKYRWHPESVCHTRWHDVIVPRQQRAIAEACVRRGIPAPSHAIPAAGQALPSAPADTAFTKAVEWSFTALGAGNARTARKHARFALHSRPLSKLSWIAMWNAYLGPRSLSMLRSVIRPIRRGRMRHGSQCSGAAARQ